MNNINLLPCPFCGGAVEYHPLSHHMNNFWNKNTIYCPSCDFMMEGSSTISLIKRWNTRKPMERIIERINKLGWIFGEYYLDGTAVNRVSKRSIPHDEVIQIVKEEGSINE